VQREGSGHGDVKKKWDDNHGEDEERGEHVVVLLVAKPGLEHEQGAKNGERAQSEVAHRGGGEGMLGGAGCCGCVGAWWYHRLCCVCVCVCVPGAGNKDVVVVEGGRWEKRREKGRKGRRQRSGSVNCDCAHDMATGGGSPVGGCCAPRRHSLHFTAGFVNAEVRCEMESNRRLRKRGGMVTA